MGRIAKDVFISYRRTNVSWALAVFQNLTQHGYDVFYDFDGLASGDFERHILENIRDRSHFIVLLTPSALERSSEPGDWLRREIETALQYQRNIVPLMLEGFDFRSPGIANQLAGELATLAKYNALRIPADYFEEAMGKLREKYLNVPVDTVLHPASSTARKAARAQQAAARRAPRVSESALSSQEWFEQGFIATDPDERLRCYNEAIRLDPDFAAAYGNRGNVLRVRGDFDGALQDYSEVIRINPDDGLAYYNRGAALYEKGDLDAAVDDLGEAIHLKPDLAAAYVGRGIALQARWFRRGISREAQVDQESALKDFEEAIRVDPDFAPAYFNRGNWYRVKGDRIRALGDYSEAIRLNPNDAAAYRNRAGARRAMEDLDGAAQDEKAAERIERKTRK